MLRWISRILIFVFTFNIFSPELLQARQISRKDLEQAVIARIDNQQTKPLAQAKSSEELDQLYAARMIELADAYDTLEITDDPSTHTALEKTVANMHRTVQDYVFFKQEFQKVQDKKDLSKNIIQPLPPATADGTYYHRDRNMHAIRESENVSRVTVAAFLNKIKKNNFTLEDLIEDMDPLIPVSEENPIRNYEPTTTGDFVFKGAIEPGKTQASYQITAYAAEIIFNTLATLSADEVPFVMDFVARLQQRAFYRLNHLPQASDGSDSIIMARGTLYMLLSQINRLYKRAGRLDPLAAQTGVYMSNIIGDIRTQKNREETKSGTINYALLKLQIEYAVRYALLADHPEALAELVSLFEEKPNGYLAMHNRVKYTPTNFQTEQTEIINTVFPLILETLKFFPVSKKTATQTAAWLTQVAGPQHATDIRVLAIGTAAKARQEKLFELTDIQRNTLANYAVDIYHPLNNSGIYGMQTYGLDSEQMRVLSDNLTNFIGALLPISAPKTTWNAQKQNYDPIPGRTVTLTPETWQRDLINKTESGVLRTEGTPSRRPAMFLFASDGSVHPVYHKNEINSRQYEQERLAFAANLVGAAVLWIFGGEIITFAFRALRLTAGAVVAIPKALKIARHAPKGKKIGIFTAKIRQSIKYGQRVETVLARSGSNIVTTRVENATVKAADLKGAPTNAPQIGAGPAASKTSTKVLIQTPVTRSGAHYVGGRTNQAGTANWFKRLGQRLFGDTPKVESYTVFSHRPGFQFTSVQLDAAGLGLEDGLNSMAAKRRFYRALQKQGFDLTPLTGAEHTLLIQEQKLMGAVGNALRFDAQVSALNVGSFDYWAYNGKAFERIAPKDFFTRTQQLAAGAANGTENVANYYNLLKISSKASPAEIKGAYHNLAKQLHPDRFATLPEAQRAIAEEQFKQLGEAYRTLSNPTARAAYDLKLNDNNPLMNAFIPQMPVSPEGYSLAITPKQSTIAGVHVTGVHTPHFNPIASGGFGINAKNVTGDLATQLTEHLVTTGQIPELGTLVVKNSPLYQAFLGNLVFFGAWDMLDRVSYRLQQPMITSAAEKQVKQELDRYGDMFAPKPSAPKQEPSLNIDVTDQINSADGPYGSHGRPTRRFPWGDHSSGRAQHEGALFTLPTFGTMLAMNKLHLVNDDLKSLLNTNAKKIELNKALAQQSRSAFNQSIDATLNELAATRKMYEDAARENPKVADAYQAVCQLLRQYEKEIQSVSSMKGDLSAKSSQLNLIIQDNNTKVEEAVVKAQQAQNNLLIAQLEDDKVFLEQLWTITPDQKKDMLAACEQAIKTLKRAGKKPLEEMRDMQNQAMDKYNQHVQALMAQMQQPAESKTWDQMTTKEQKKALRRDWESAQEAFNAYQAEFEFYGDAAVAEFKQLIQTRSKEVEVILNNSRLTAQEQADSYYPLINQLEIEMITMLNRYATQASEEMEELLPSAY